VCTTCDAQRVPRLQLHPRKSGNAAESMELDCTHDGGVTEPQCRTFGWVSDTRQHGSGVRLKPLWERQVRGSIPHVHESRGCHSLPSPIARLTSTGCCVGWPQRHFATTGITPAVTVATPLRPLCMSPGARNRDHELVYSSKSATQSY
jgi:hypothetical protein